MRLLLSPQAQVRLISQFVPQQEESSGMSALCLLLEIIVYSSVVHCSVKVAAVRIDVHLPSGNEGICFLFIDLPYRHS